LSWPRLSLAASLVLGGLVVGGVATVALRLETGAGSLGAIGATKPPLLLAVAAAAGWLAFLTGTVLYVVLPSLSPVTAREDYASFRTMVACLIVAAIPANLLVLAYALLTRGSSAAPRTPSPGLLVLSVIALELSLLGVVYLRLIYPGVLRWRDLGLTSEAVPSRALVGIAVAFGTLVLVAGVQLVLRSAGVEQNQAELYIGIRGAPLWQFLVLLVGGSVLAPLAEETFFRGYVFGFCLRTRGPWLAYAFSAALFAAAHFNLPSIGPIFVIGLWFAYVYSQTGSLIPCIVAHGVNNAVALSVLYFGPSPVS
jgi:membrane protease YdiL (CAAX protease family)